MKNKIQLSQEAADCIPPDCKDIWVKPRETLIDVKGKGMMQTYWLQFKTAGTESAVSSDVLESTLLTSQSPEEAMANYSPEDIAAAQSEKLSRLIDWNVEVLHGLLQKIVAARTAGPSATADNPVGNLRIETDAEATILDEVKEVIALPSHSSKGNTSPNMVALAPEVERQLRQYVENIASLYHEHRFHSFEHASHVTQSVMKLLERVVSPDTIERLDSQEFKWKASSASCILDPLTQFAVAFSAIIHDVDHKGVPNMQLVKEQSAEAKRYRYQSVAEQNSVDIAWWVLMEPEFRDLRACIFSTEEELTRFRQVVVNTVMATDIVDKKLGALRRKRWDTAFHGKVPTKDDANRKATIVIEHLIQASDVSHTMQHWHVYLKWVSQVECVLWYHACVYTDCMSNRKIKLCRLIACLE